MDDKIVRFLKSLGIKNIEDYDMSFEMCNRNRFNREQIDMIILKQTPWIYFLAEQFQQALSKINYPYYLRFAYKNRPIAKDVIALINEWYQSIYRLPFNLNVDFNDKDVIFVHYVSNSEKEQFQSVIADFRDYLNFLCYEFVIIEDIVEVSNVLSDQERQALEETASFSVEETDISELINEENKAHAQKVEQEMKEKMDLIIQEKERMRFRAKLNKRGNYQTVDFIDAITGNSGNVQFEGKVFKLPDKEKIEKRRDLFGIRDKKGGCILVSITTNKNKQFTIDDCNAIKMGSNVLVRGVAFSNNGQVMIAGHNIMLLEPDVIEKEPSDFHRVELHTHTIMSDQDGVNSASDYIAYAKALGHTAIAFTDHGVVQSFPEAEAFNNKNGGLKIIYGCEFYMVEDHPQYIFNPSKVRLNKAKYVVLDLETTGLSARYDKVTEFGAVRIENNSVVDRIDILINPECEIPPKIIQKTGITPSMLKDKPTFKDVAEQIKQFIGDAIIVSHNAEFDFPFLNKEFISIGEKALDNPVIDTLPLSQYLFPTAKGHRLGDLCKRCGVEYDKESAHRADYDAKVLSDVWFYLIHDLTKNNENMMHEQLQSLPVSDEQLTHLRGLHCVVIAKNKAGLRSLYELVSLSHITYMADIPKIPRREIISRRENLIVGSACLNGEVFRTAKNRGHDRLKEIMSFYDYIELQPLENYSILVNTDELTYEQIKQYQLDIIQAADELNIPVVATGDVHYLTPEQKIFRDIFIANKTNGRRDHPLHPYKKKEIYGQFDNPNQHFRTTQEMLDAFSFLGEKKAFEIVVTNSNKIADLTEKIEIIKPNFTYAPRSPEFDNALRTICNDKLHEQYGDNPDSLIVERMNIELDKIIKSEFSIVYYYCYLIIKKAVDEGYIVGSRGSVGSSFVATLMGITEVNPLPPHYICPNCHHFIWSNEEYPSIHNGYDLPEKECPMCGKKMRHNGVDIPFETFLGTEGEVKVPDIDLNFARDYQARAHNTLKELAGEDYVFRAGTIGTVAEKTAFAYAKTYLSEDQDIDVSTYPQAKIEYLASGCVGVKKQTGRHAGGVIIIPREHNINEFVPIQYPADDKESSWFTTHFDYRSMHDLLLKFDLLGQLEPMTIKICRDLTGVSLDDIPMNDPKVLSLFTSAKALNMKHDYLLQKTGALGLPEFGTQFVRQIIEETRPTTFEDLVVIQGLSHGTDVWTGNAQDLIRQGVASLKEIIGCRDDIMMYLQRMNISKDNAFKIMETVRKKDKFLTQAQIDLMKANNVPDFYIESCDKIKYLFPKAHAVAYTIMAMRTGYFKVYYPLEYYAAYLSVKLGKFNISALVEGEKAVIRELDKLNMKEKMGPGIDKLSDKEKDIKESLEVGLEMIQRGFSFSNIDIERSEASNFSVDKARNCLIPPLTTLDGLGEANAQSVIEARKEKPFTSIEDLTRRTKLTKTNIQSLKELGALKDLNETDQISLF